MFFRPKEYFKTLIVKIIFIFPILFTSNILAQTISGTGGTAPCGDCTPAGWIDSAGTPDISSANNSGGQGSTGGLATWANAPLPLPPTGDSNWVTLRDVGPNYSEEAISTQMGGLISGKIYKLTLYTMTTLSNQNGGSGTVGAGSTYYAGTYMDAFDYQVESNGRQTITTISQNQWGESVFYFIGDPENGSNEMTLTLYPRGEADFQNNGDAIDLEMIHIAVDLNALELLDSDNDNIDDSVDIDDDNDGIIDIDEYGNYNFEGDEDGDGLPNYVDTNDDGTGDGSATDYTDSNGDGIPDVYDADNDGIPNHLDLDADNDGIPDNIEAQTTLGYIAPSGSESGITDANNNGLDDNYESSQGGTDISPIDTDSTLTNSDSIADFLDTDSDGDGVSDTVEANLNISGEVGINGLYTPFDNGDDYADVNGFYDDTQSDNFIDADGDVNGVGGDVDWRDEDQTGSQIDTDLDGVSDNEDIDDDNDGILDIDEISSCSGSLNYEFYDLTPSGSTVANIPTSGALSTGTYTSFDVDALQGSVDPGDSDSFSIRYTGYIRINSTDTYTFYTSSDDGSRLFIDDVQVVDNDGDHGVRERSGSISLTEGLHKIRVLFYENGGGEFLSVSYDDAGSLISKITIPFSNLFPICDEDGDGIPNHLDLDSDNDGIPDNIEAQSTTGYTAPTGSVGNNGLDTAYKSNDTFAATSNLLPINTDSADNPDYLDTDSDNDGTNDQVEANLSLSGNVGTNGLDSNIENSDSYADVNGNFDDTQTDNFPDADGDVNSGGDADYRDTDSSFTDNDNDGVTDLMDLDDDNDGILDTVESGIYDPEGDEDGDGIINYKDTSDGGGSGDGSTTDYTDANSDGIADVFDLDNDGIPNHFDLDSDGDAIPDNIEAQTTTGYIAFNTVINQTTGISEAYNQTTGLTPVNTDGTDTPDYLDTDSDNDGFLDNAEANLIITGSVGVNGLVNTYDNGDNYMDVNGNFDNSQTDNFPDADGDVNSGGDADYRDDTFTFDNDDDDVNDEIDLDDDNDGVVDAIEYGTCTPGGSEFNWATLYTESSTQTLDEGEDPISGTTTHTINFVNVSITRSSNQESDSDYRINDVISDNNFVYTLGQKARANAESTHNFNFDSPVYGLSFNLVDLDIDVTTTGIDEVELIITKEDGTLYQLTASDYSISDSSTFAANTFTGDDTNNGTVSINALTDWIINLKIIYRNAGTGSIGGDQRIGIGNLYFCTPEDTDGDGVFNFKDLDSDNDGIPDNIEAQSTSGYIPPSGTYSIFGIDVAYNTGVTPVNSDSSHPTNADSTPDYLDIDADGDGIFDIVESGDGLTDAGSDGDFDGTVGVNGLADSLETDGVDTGYSDVNGTGDDSITDNYTDTDGDVNSPSGDLDYRDISAGIDTDGDGIIDTIDIDDDNDGIIDYIEQNCTLNTTISNAVGAVSLAQGGVTNISETYDGTITGDNGAVVNRVGEGIIVDLGGTVSNGTTITIHFWANNSTLKTVIYSQSTDATEGSNLSNMQSYSSNASSLESVDYTLTSDATHIEFEMTVRSNTSGGRIEIVEIEIPSYTYTGCNTSLDTDSDGIVDSLDIDADNDGIPDNIEAQPTIGYISPSGTGAGITDANNNGLDDNYETAQGGTDITTPINTDSSIDTVPDYLDTDSDNDGTPDIEENGDSDTVASGVDTDGDGLDDNFEGSNFSDGFDVNDEINTPSTDLPDVDSDVATQDVDYRDAVDNGVTPITAGKILWVRSDKDAGGTTTLTSWTDQTSTGIVNTINGNPTIDKFVNFNPVVTFDGNGDYIQTNLETYAGVYPDLTVFAVYTPAANQANAVWGEDDNQNDDRYFRDHTTGTTGEIGDGDGGETNLSNSFIVDNTVIATIAFDEDASNSSVAYLNGDEIITFTTNHANDSTNDFQIGAAGDSNEEFEGSISEIIVLGSIPTDIERQSLHSYLAIKNGITLNSSDDSPNITEGDYILSDETTKIWDYSASSGYHNDIAAIGKDDGFVVNQRQSKSSNQDGEAHITIGLTQIETSNKSSDNSYAFDANKTFLVWGNNDVSLTSTSSSTLICAEELVMSRIWKIVETGSVGSVQIAIPETVLNDALTTGYTARVMKVADDASFTTNVQYVPVSPETVDNISQYVTNYDFDGTKYFTYAEVNGIFWNGDLNAWSGGAGTGNQASTELADTDKVMIIDSQSSGTHALLTEDAQVECVWIKENSVLTVDTDKFLELDEDFILDGDLRMKGHAHLVQTHVGQTNVQGTGNIYIDQTATVPNVYRYHYWTSPVVEVGKSTFRVSEVMKDGNTPTSEVSQPKNITFIDESVSYDGAIGDNDTAITIANYWIWSFINGTTGNDWQHKRHNTPINRGEGYTMKSTGKQDGQNFTFVGTPNDGTIIIPLIKDTNSLVGNPYPSALDAIDFINENLDVINGTIYFWEHKGEKSSSGATDGHNIRGYQGGYSTRNLSLGVAAQTSTAGTDGLGSESYTPPGRYIAVGQAFYVGAHSDGNLVFENSHRNAQVLDNENSVFFKNGGKKSSNTLRRTITDPDVETSYIKLGFEYENDLSETIHRQIGVAFKNNLTFEFERGYDSYAFDIQPTDIYWDFDGANKYSIAGIENVSDDLKIPITITIDNSQEVKFILDGISHIEREVYLVDNITSISYELNEQPISLNLDTGTYSDRFSLRFSKLEGALSYHHISNTNFTIFYNNKTSSLEIINKDSITINSMSITNMVGQEIRSIVFNNSPKEVSIKNIPDGIYNVKLETSAGVISRRIAKY